MEASESPINAPHPDDDEVEAFFGTSPEEGVSAAEADAPTADDPAEVESAPDPADFDPTRGDFGETDTEGDVSGVEIEATPEPADDSEPSEEDTSTDAKADPTPPAESAGPTDAHGQSVSEGVAGSAVPQSAEAGTTPSAVEPSPTTPGDGETASANGKKSSTEREYLVFQEVPLTEKVLKHLLTQIEAGEAPAPRLAYFELHRPVARNVNGAITAAYNANQKALGKSGADLAAVSANAFQKRHVEPKQVVETALSIS